MATLIELDGGDAAVEQVLLSAQGSDASPCSTSATGWLIFRRWTYVQASRESGTPPSGDAPIEARETTDRRTEQA
jgi:hypothetical protein